MTRRLKLVGRDSKGSFAGGGGGGGGRIGGGVELPREKKAVESMDAKELVGCAGVRMGLGGAGGGEELV